MQWQPYRNHVDPNLQTTPSNPGAEPINTTTDTPRIYVACLKSYNAGKLHGRWIDATDTEKIHEDIQEMLAETKGEEWAIHDYENFGGLTISEYENIDGVVRICELIEEHGEAFAVFADHEGVKYATVDRFEEAYCGQWDSEKDYAENLFDELYVHEVPNHIASYIDYEAFARDLFMCGDYFSLRGESGQLYIFRCC